MLLKSRCIVDHNIISARTVSSFHYRECIFRVLEILGIGLLQISYLVDNLALQKCQKTMQSLEVFPAHMRIHTIVEHKSDTVPNLINAIQCPMLTPFLSGHFLSPIFFTKFENSSDFFVMHVAIQIFAQFYILTSQNKQYICRPYYLPLNQLLSVDRSLQSFTLVAVPLRLQHQYLDAVRCPLLFRLP